MHKQVILVRTDLNLPKGKLGAQCAHACVDAVLKCLRSKEKSEIVKKWKREGMMKVVLKVKDKKELYKYLQEAKDQNIATALITDAGKTIVAPGTVTCIAIGPDLEEKIDNVTGELKIL